MTGDRNPRLIITSGEPAGIGPDLCLQLAEFNCPAQLVVAADIDLLKKRASVLGLNVTIRQFNPNDNTLPSAGTLLAAHTPTVTTVEPGKLQTKNSQYVVSLLRQAVQGCRNGVFDAMITAPVHKSVIQHAGIPFTGHTEFLADETESDRVVMMLATEGLRVALATTHLPLAEVPSAITRTSLEQTVRILHQSLQRTFAIREPTILVCGLNPHAGEQGCLGNEEIDVIEPVLNTLRKEKINLVGPLPADTLFQPNRLKDADAVLAMYHDQGLPVLKYKGFGNAVNITLGLPIIRTSVDHGTALDLAGSGRADPGSLHTAIEYALTMINGKRNVGSQ